METALKAFRPTRSVFARFTSLLLMGCAVGLSPSVGLGQQPTTDLRDRIKTGIQLIKLACGTGVETRQIKIEGGANATFTVKRLPGVEANGQVTYSNTEAQALATSLQDAITHEGYLLSSKQLDCMKPYAKQIFEVLFPTSLPQDATAGDKLAPIYLTLRATETRPLNGYIFRDPPVVPHGLAPGPILPGGGRTRIVMQAARPDQVVQIDKISIETEIVVEGKDPTTGASLAYTIDPTRQSGFGPARPHQFLVRIGPRGTVKVSYVGNSNRTISTSPNSILPPQAQLLRLDAHSGLQEALDFTIIPEQQGFYRLTFKVDAVSGGKEYALRSSPIYIVRR